MATIYGTDLDDELNGGSGKDKLYGKAGNDTLYGNAGDDKLYGQEGNDRLFGGTGSDVFYYAKGEGHDTIADYTEGKDLVFVNSGLISKTVANSGELKFTVERGSITLDDAATQVISLKDKRGNYTASASAIVLESNFKGTMDSSTFLATVTTIDGSAAVEAVKLNGNGNDNVITGGAGNDTLTGSGGKDTLIGGTGDDYLYGGQGDDTLTGGAGKDTFAYGKGQGNDIVKDYTKGDDVIEITKGGISKTALNGKDLVYTIGDGSLTLQNAGTKAISIKDTQGSYQASSANIVLNEDYTGTINAAQFLSTVITVKGQNTTSDVVIKGNANANELYGGSGNNEMYGEKGDDTVYGYGGADTLYGGAGSDKLYGGEGNDVLYGDSGSDSLYGEGGTNTLYGGNGKDKLYSDSGSDTLVGGIGTDVYVLRAAFTGETAISIDQSDASSKDADTLQIRTLNKDDVSYALAGGVLTITDNNTGGKVTVSGWDVSPLASIKFKDATVTKAEIDDALAGGEEAVTLYINGNGQTVNGSSLADTIWLVSGSDNTINGLAGDDKLLVQSLSGPDADTLIGAGNRIFGGAGNDTIATMNSNQITPICAPIYVDAGAGNDEVTIDCGGRNEGAGGSAEIYGGAGNDTIKVYGDDITVYGGDDNDTIYLMDTNNAAILGDEGNDTICVRGLSWNSANTMLAGGKGDDTYEVDVFEGSIIYIDQSGTGSGDVDSLKLNLELYQSQTTLYLSENGDMELTLGSCVTTDGMEDSGQIFIQNWYDHPLSSISFVSAGNGGTLTVITSGFNEPGTNYTASLFA